MTSIAAFQDTIRPAADLLVTEVRAAYARFTGAIDAALTDAGVEAMPKADQEAFSAAVLEITSTAARQIEEEG
jgi:hypothetical protein